MKIKNSVLVILIITFLILNVFLFVRHQTISKEHTYKPPTQLPGLKVGDLAPSFSLKDLKGKLHSSDELKDKIALLIFCEIKDEKSLLEAYYYKLLLGKYKDRGLVAWIISNPIDTSAPKNLDQVYSPLLILEDKDSKVTKAYCDKRSGRFQAYLLDKDERIRFRDYNLPNLLTRLTVEKFVSAKEETLTKDEFTNGASLPPLQYYDLKARLTKRFQNFPGRPILLTLFSANCPTCREHRRLAFLRSIYDRYNPKGLKVILLYGKDNPSSIIGDYVQENKLPFDIGIIRVKPDMSDDYYENYDLKVDPKSIVIDSKGKVIFVEGPKETEELIRKELENLFKKVRKY